MQNTLQWRFINLLLKILTNKKYQKNNYIDFKDYIITIDNIK